MQTRHQCYSLLLEGLRASPLIQSLGDDTQAELPRTTLRQLHPRSRSKQWQLPSAYSGEKVSVLAVRTDAQM